MRKTKRVMLLAFVIMISVMSCNNEELFIEPVGEEVVEDKVEYNEEDNEVALELDALLPCDFSIDNIEPNSTVIISCLLDLGGSTVNIPEAVTFLYEGGDIINGTLNLSDNTIISQELLNATLILDGSVPQLKDTTFNFDPQRWGIVEGKVTDAVALNNTIIINDIINKTKAMSATTFEIGKMDAYFDVATAEGEPRHDTDATIFIPSNFHFKMGDDCNLRVQPNSMEKSVLIYSRSTENVTISGGKLWGDRYAHDYKTIPRHHEHGHVMMIRGVHNSTIDGVEMHEGVGDGIAIGGTAHRNNDGTLKPDGRESYNVTIKNCLIEDNRRNNISITDGTNIFIEYNTIRKAGSGDDSSEISSNGTSPRCGIDIEGFKNNAPDNNSVYDWEKTENIHIRHNIFEENYAADVVLYNGEKTYVYENTFRSYSGVGAAYGYNSKIYSNTFERPEGLMSGSRAIGFEGRYWENGTHRNIGFEVYDNTITGYQFAVLAGGQGHTYKNNTITDCERGFILLTSEDHVFNDNKISSNVDNSYGYYTFTDEISIKNCLIKNEEISVQNRDIFLTNKNNEKAGDITIDNVKLNGGGLFLNSAQNITLKNSKFVDIKILDSDPILVNNN